MGTSKDILKPFEVNRSFMEDRIASGIESGRKGWAILKCKDKEGKFIPGVKIRAIQKSHDFKFGANLFMLKEFDQPEQNETYERYFAQAFNLATLPFYWGDLEPEQGKPRYAKDSPKIYRRPAPDLCLEFCQARNIEPKLHCLNYAGQSPAWVPMDTASEKFYLTKRFRELAERYSKAIPSWEVTNETFWGYNHFFPFYNEPDFVEWSFKTAEKFLPANKLIINEAHNRIWDNAHFYGTRSPYYMQIENALLKGCRIDSIGMQYHMFFHREKGLECTAEFYNPRRIFELLDTYAILGRPLQITELTIPAYSYEAEDEALQAEIIRNLYSMWFSHPAMEAIIYWNLIDGFAYGAKQGDMNTGENYYHGGLLRYDFTPKPAYQTIFDLFHKEYITDTCGKLSSDGETVSFKGFYGNYDLEVTLPDGRTEHKEFHLCRQQGQCPEKYLYFN